MHRPYALVGRLLVRVSPSRYLTVAKAAARLAAWLIVLVGAASPIAAQQREAAQIIGRVSEATTGKPIRGAEVLVEGTGLRVLTDTAGRYRLLGVPAGVQSVVVRRIGYAVSRAALTIPTRGVVTHDVALAQTALEMPEITVTAEPAARARGELGTASVIDREAVANQTATSLAGVLELVPGVPLQQPGLGDVQQFALRTVPTTFSVGATAGGASTADIASLGTAIVLDGVPVSNNANLQSLGPRGEIPLPGATGRGGIDLRQIPAATIDRVEVIRGVPSARYGDLTQGVIVVDTRAGVVPPAIRASFDPATLAGSFVGGRAFGRRHAVTLDADVAHTNIQPGILDDDAWRVTGQLAHHLSLGDRPSEDGGLQFDTRVRFFQVSQNNPEQPEVEPGRAATNHDHGLRVSERATLGRQGASRLVLSAAFDQTIRQSTSQLYLIRGATPFTDRLTEGRQEGHYVLGSYLARAQIDGAESNFFARLEGEHPFAFLGFEQQLVGGLELRREWNTGAGYQFDIEFPPQSLFNGVQGFDRPWPFDALPPLVTSAAYLDDRLHRELGPVGISLQAGVRVDALHDGAWFGGVRDALVQPRLNAELAPMPWLRLRGGWGRTAKTPSLGQLAPPPQYFDVVNVNWYAVDPAERLAVLTTFIRDPTNPDLAFSTGEKAEAGFELATARGDAAISVVAFRDKTTGGVSVLPQPIYVLRDHYDLTDSTAGTGKPPQIIEPATYADTMPVLLERPANILTLESKGWEGTLVLPELRPLRLTVAAQGAWITTSLFQDGPDFGRTFGDFQLDPTVPRAPYWENVVRKGARGIVTARLIHHQPQLGLVASAVIEYFFAEWQEDVASTDTLAFSGYVTRDGTMVPVPPEERGDPQYADLRVPRTGTFRDRTEAPNDWMLSVQVSKTLPLGGVLRFYGFNVLDRLGRVAPRSARSFQRMRFGLEVTMPLASILPVGYEVP